MIVRLLIALVVLFSQATLAGVARDIGDDLASPVTTPAKTVFFIGSGLALTAAIFEDSITDPIQREATESRPLGQFATQMGNYAGPMIPNLVYALGMASYGFITDSSNAQRRALVMTKSSVYAPLVSGAIKFIIQEPRPDGSDHYSFPSGHTTAAFSFASVIQSEHGWILGSVAYAWAAVVGFGRMNDNRHFLHDVIAGAAIGTSYGLAMHDRSLELSPESSAIIQILPTDVLDGVVAIYSKTF